MNSDSQPLPPDSSDPPMHHDEPPSQPRPAADAPTGSAKDPGYFEGLKQDAEDLKQAAARYASARAQLLGIEAKEAASEIGGAAARLAAAAFFGVIFYLLIIAGLIGLAEHYRPDSWPIATLIIAAAHLILALLLFFSGKRNLSNPDRFSESLKQFEHDREWLNQTSKKH
ncbi:phage holin family protein [Sulfuriroseicoccus oceanibius]|uniref:Phage holin family protein n=1 Tax=Sulfuriroseicoccus oceanibius TaxID=2707525 RepID=A0A6B3L314_9BACT|nr:phage holin family protein [Sulfuriroseicoccus oceanibius]QQL46229.1 phage holin family protein [Sulfuriroseicoccus oceanibius]